MAARGLAGQAGVRTAEMAGCAGGRGGKGVRCVVSRLVEAWRSVASAGPGVDSKLGRVRGCAGRETPSPSMAARRRAFAAHRRSARALGGAGADGGHALGGARGQAASSSHSSNDREQGAGG